MYRYQLALLIASYLLCACSSLKGFSIYEESKATGTVGVLSNYKTTVAKETIWQESKQIATSRCKEWGYRAAEPLDQNEKECLAYNLAGICTEWQVFQEYRCQ